MTIREDIGDLQIAGILIKRCKERKNDNVYDIIDTAVDIKNAEELLHRYEVATR